MSHRTPAPSIERDIEGPSPVDILQAELNHAK